MESPSPGLCPLWLQDTFICFPEPTSLLRDVGFSSRGLVVEGRTPAPERDHPRPLLCPHLGDVMIITFKMSAMSVSFLQMWDMFYPHLGVFCSY